MKKDFNNLVAEAKRGSGWTGNDETDACAIILSGPKGVACIPSGDRKEIQKLADAFSVIARAETADVKMITVEEAEVYDSIVGGPRFDITGGGLHFTIAVKDNISALRFFRQRIDRKKKLRLTLSLADLGE
jgi:hypothetical protein